MVQVIECENNKVSSNNSIAPRRTTMKKFNSQENMLNSLPTLGLTLRKTPSFVNLIEESLARQEAKNVSDSAEEQAKAKGRSLYDRPKASNFPAKMLKIGSWEVVSLNESQLVAKCYYAKKKLIWEVMEDGLKSKMEIQWSDISAIRATMVKDEDGILEVELSLPPTFAREHTPQAGKHSSWYPCLDFTGGQASTCRIHYLRFPPGFLDKPFKTLLYHDLRIFEMSHKPFPSSNNPYFTWNPSTYVHYMAAAQAQPQIDNLSQFTITKIPRDMTTSNQIPITETTIKNAPHVTYYPCQMPGNDLPFGDQVMDQVPGKPSRPNRWTLETNDSEQAMPAQDSNSQFHLDTLANILNVDDFIEPTNLDVENLGENQKGFMQNFLCSFEEEHPDTNKETLVNPTSLQVNPIDGQSYYQQPVPAPSNPIRFSDNPNPTMHWHNYHFANAPPRYALPGGLNNYVPANRPCDIAYNNQMDPWNEG